MCAILTFRNWVIFTVVCVAVAVYLALRGYPSLPLDSGVDPATLAAYQAAVIAHWLRYAAVGLGVPIVLLVIGRLVCGGKGST